jgi:DNA-binding CsgD family transcriptional regulator
VHYRESYYGLGDLAAVAVRTGHRDEAAALLDRSVRELGDGPSPRLAALLARAEALLSEDPEPAFRRALAHPAGEQWPFERAQILLDQGQWLRRERRVSQARSPLTGALAVFERLRARPWADRARTELRAAGVTAARKADSAFAGLTAQQQQIARLAAQGLTNREIGERLLLSPRTIAFHLYGIFPKLNITARAQLRDIVEASGAEL